MWMEWEIHFSNHSANDKEKPAKQNQNISVDPDEKDD